MRLRSLVSRSPEHPTIARPHIPQHDPKEPIEATQRRSPTFSLQHSNLLAEGEHLQRDIQTPAKEHREGGENRANYIDHKSAVTRAAIPSAAFSRSANH
jgi:hypothetical protein